MLFFAFRTFRLSPRVAAAALAVCLIVGCGITPRRVWRHPNLARSDVSPRSAQTVRALRPSGDGTTAGGSLTAQFAAGPRDAGTAFSLAEIYYAGARRAEQAGSNRCVDHYFMAAAFAWHCLFAPDAPAHPDPRHLRSVALYNSAVAKSVEAGQRFGRFEAPASLRVLAPGGTCTARLEYHGFTWVPEEIGRLVIVGDYDVQEMSRRHIRRGLGAPLVGIRQAGNAPEEEFFPGNLPCPVTAVMRPNLDALLGVVAEPTSEAATLEFYDPTRTSTLLIEDRSVNMAADLSAPWALALMDPDRTDLEIGGYFSPESTADSTGLYLFEPYQPGKIPLVLVHGLFSGPLTWADLINDLQLAAGIRERYQIWAFRYPSGGPLLEIAARLRSDLRAVRDAVDPARRDKALDHAVLLGHSLGGLIAKLQVSHAGCTVWQRYANRPLETLNLTEADRRGLRDWFFFEPVPCVGRVVFLATPHRGARARNRYAARLAAPFVSLPESTRTARRIVRCNPGAFRTSADGLLATVAGVLSANDRLSATIRELPVAAGVKTHSIIGTGQTLWDGSDSDGTVPVSSARLPDVESECLVPAAHGMVQRHAQSVAEIRRILRKHLEEFDLAQPRSGDSQ